MWLSDFRLVLPDRIVAHGSIRVENGRIVDVVDGVHRDADVAGRGMMLIPGIIDLHGDMLEREIEPRPRAVLPADIAIFELDKRLVATGVTTAFTAVSFHQTPGNPRRTHDSARDVITAVGRLRGELLSEFLVHARFEITNPEAGDALRWLIEHDHVHLVSLTDHTPGQGQYRDIERFVRTMIEWRKRQTGHTATEDEMRAQVRESQGRPKSWDVVRAVARCAGARGIPLASHDDDSPEKVEFVSELGATISEFPITLEAARAAKAAGMHVVMGAPNALLGQSNSNNLSARDAIRAGVVDVLVADYHPGSLLQSVHRVVAARLLSWPEAINLVTRNAARAVGLSDRGSLEAGKLADLVMVETGDHPRVRGTFRRGRLVYWDGSVDLAGYGLAASRAS